MASNEGGTSPHFTSVEWKPLSLTHVEYPNGDFVGYVLAWCSMLPIFLCISFGTLIVFRRDLHTICYFGGILLNEMTNWALKHTIKEPRPQRGRTGLFTEFGMPSSHSQFMWFFAIYLVFFLRFRVHHNMNRIENLWKYCTFIGGFASAIAVSYSRVYLGYHTSHQVAWGAVAGAIAGSMWFLVVQFILTPFFPTISGWPISEFFMLRDSTLIPNVLWFEYISHRQESRSRRRKNTARKSQ